MTLLKKIDPAWAPAEKKDLRVGETVEIGDVEALVKSGAAVIVDENGIEQPLPGQKFLCPICYKETTNLSEFTDHVNNAHRPKKVEPTATAIATDGKFQTASEVDTMKEEAKPEVVKTSSEAPKKTPEELREMRLANLKAARERRAAVKATRKVK